MKRVKVLLATALVAVLAIGTFAFTTGSYHKAFAPKCYYYTGPQNPTQSQFENVNNWTTAGTPPAGCDDGIDLCALCYDDDNESYSNSLLASLQTAWPAFSGGTAAHGTTISGTDTDSDTFGIEIYYDEQ